MGLDSPAEMLRPHGCLQDRRSIGLAQREIMCRFPRVVELVGHFFAVDDGDIRVLSMRLVDQTYCCFVVCCCHCGVWKVYGYWVSFGGE